MNILRPLIIAVPIAAATIVALDWYANRPAVDVVHVSTSPEVPHRFAPWTYRGSRRVVAADSEWEKAAELHGIVEVDADMFSQWDRQHECLGRLMDLIDNSPATWIVATKFPENVRTDIAACNRTGPPRLNMVLLVQIESQIEAEYRIPELDKVRDVAAMYGLRVDAVDPVQVVFDSRSRVFVGQVSGVEKWR